MAVDASTTTGIRSAMQVSCRPSTLRSAIWPVFMFIVCWFFPWAIPKFHCYPPLSAPWLWATCLASQQPFADASFCVNNSFSTFDADTSTCENFSNNIDKKLGLCICHLNITFKTGWVETILASITSRHHCLEWNISVRKCSWQLLWDWQLRILAFR